MFKLLIECSKDIDTLSINFSDGTTVVTESSKEQKEQKSTKETKEPKDVKRPNERKQLDKYLDTDVDFNIDQTVVEKPVIADLDRPAKVSEEIQNFEF